MNEKLMFLDIGYSQLRKKGQNICGDVFKSMRMPGENRVIAALSDGLGSGVKANILASMTVTMALKFAANNMEIGNSAEIIMSALPVCRVRKISYATFTIMDASLTGTVRITEMGNPPALLVRNGKGVPLKGNRIESAKWKDRSMDVYEIDALPRDRIVIFSDGISQAGMGTDKYKLGWKNEGCLELVEEIVKNDSDISSHDLSGQIVKAAAAKDPGFMPHDDMTCAVVHFRKPKKMLLFTGPPFSAEKDAECAKILDAFQGRKVVCGGTTAEIIGRELDRKITMDVRTLRDDLPPLSQMDGVDLVTEGIFTLTKTARLLKNGVIHASDDAAGQLVDALLSSDIIEFLVGTRINEAHQDPNLPMDLELRRNIIKRIARILKDKYMKETKIKFV